MFHEVIKTDYKLRVADASFEPWTLLKCHLPWTLSKLPQCTKISQCSFVWNPRSKIAKFYSATKIQKVAAITQQTSAGATKQNITWLKILVKTAKLGWLIKYIL